MHADDELVRLRIKILMKWGFLPFYEPHNERQRQYVHVSGSMFVLITIPSAGGGGGGSNTTNGSSQTPTNAEAVPSPHDEYITRHFSGVRQTGDHKESKFIKVEMTAVY